MNTFIENCCRLCPKAFCCKKCRFKHETDYHNVVSQCDICIYGTFVFGNIDETILQHIKETHLPLNCVYCKRVFSGIEEIIQHKICPVYHKTDSPKTPLYKSPEIVISADDQDSPILQELQRNQALNFIFQLATSTPMHNTEAENFHNNKNDDITPSERFQISNKSIIKKTLKKSDESSKKRVTFSETTGTTYSIEYNSNETEKTDSIKNPHILKDESVNTKSPSTPIMAVKEISADEFYSAKSEINQSSEKVQKARYDGNKTSMMNLEDISTPVGIPMQSEIVRSQLDIYKCVKVKDTSTSNQTYRESDSELSSEVKQIITNTNNNESEMEICSPKLLDMVIPAETFYSAKSEVASSSIKKEHLKFESKRNYLLEYDDISTPVCALKSSQGVCPKLEINETEDAELDIIDQTSCKSSNSLAKDADSNTTNSQEKSMEMCSPCPTNEVTNQQTVATEAKVQTSVDAKLKMNDDSNSPNKTECDNTEDPITYRPTSQTLWHSATNIEDNDSDKENIPHEENIKHVDLVKETRERRVSVVMPTPVLRRADFHMKIRLPVHFTSTPVTPIEEVNAGPVSNIENLGSKVPPQTPYETPQGSCSQFIGAKIFGSGIEPYSKIEAGQFNIEDKLGLPLAKPEHYTQKEMPDYQQGNEIAKMTESVKPVKFTSTSSMTEFNLWSSMTRVVRSVLGFSKKNEDCSANLVSTSLKRQLSEGEIDVLEPPQRKRFKSSDIKGRKPIRSTSLLVPTSFSGVASFELIGSTRTLYNGSRKTKCDKYTQTDDVCLACFHRPAVIDTYSG